MSVNSCCFEVADAQKLVGNQGHGFELVDLIVEVTTSFISHHMLHWQYIFLYQYRWLSPDECSGTRHWVKMHWT